MPKPVIIPMMFDGWDSTVFKPKDGKDRPGLYLEECSYQAAKYAVEHWHYSGRMPYSPAAMFGIWDNGDYLGAILYSGGSTPAIGHPYGLGQGEIIELVRVAMDEHSVAVSQVVAVSIRLMHRAIPSTRLIVSFADPSIGHIGRIYQAGNWVFTGLSDQAGNTEFFVNGDWLHTRTLAKRYGTASRNAIAIHLPEAPTRKASRRYRYLYPLDTAMRAQIEPLRKPYPKCVGSADGGTATVQVAGGGSIPTATLRDK